MLRTVKLGEVCLVRRGTTITKKQSFHGNIPVIGGGTRATYFHNEANRGSNCITISGSGASAGFVNKWDMPIFASDCSTVEVRNENNLPQFVYYFLLYKQNFIYENLRSGAAQPHVYAKDIAQLDYCELPIAKQERIVAILDSAFSEIDKIEHISNTSHKTYTQLLKQIISQCLGNRKYNWVEKYLNQISINLDSKRKPITKSKRIKGKFPYYGASGIVDYVDDYIFDDDLLLISEDGANLLSRSYPIAFSIKGRTWVNNHAHVLKFNSNNLQYWVEMYLNFKNIDNYISGMAQPKLNQAKLNQIPIPVPEENKLNEILEIIYTAKEIVKKAQANRIMKLELLRNLKSSMLSKEFEINALLT